MIGNVRKILPAAIVLVIAMSAASAAAEDEDSIHIDSVAEDLGFGDYELPDEARFGEPTRIRGRVDQRFELNPLSDRTISWPTGYIAPQGSVTISNQMFLGQRINVSVRDSLQLFGLAFLPLGSQTYAGAGAQMHVAEGDEWNLAVGVQGRYRRTNLMPGTAESGLGLHAVFDVIASDNTTWNVGVAGHVPVYRAVEEVDLSGCESRRESAEGQCGTTNRATSTMPGSGYWASLFVGASHFVNDQIILNVEAFTGASQGNFFALQSALDPDMDYSLEQSLVEDSSWSSGLGPLGMFTLGLGSTWRFGNFAAQTSLYITNYDGEAQILPYVSLGFGIGGEGSR